MADFISNLTGVQMDNALLDMAEHNSEAYAVGERNGVPVDSSDVTYHNNARYYAQQAQSIAPASVTEAVRWDVAQTALTDSNREQARANIKAANTNPNILMNGWFTVNQRGDTNISSAGYHLDRWYSYSSYTVTANGLSVGTANLFDQCLESTLKTALNGKTITMSAMNSDGTVYSATGTYNAAPSGNITIGTNGLMRFIITGNGSPRFQPTGAFTLRAVKLELGSVSTLANDAPPDYGTELDKCRKYFYRIKAETTFGVFGSGFCSAGNAAYVLVPINMRNTPTSGSTSGAFRLMVSAGVTTGVTVTYSGNSNSHMARFDISQSGSSWTAGGSCILSAHSDPNAYIDLSADL